MVELTNEQIAAANERGRIVRETQPHARAASAFAADVVRPALAAIHFAVPNTPLTRPGTV